MTLIDKADALLPCPFCGSTDLYFPHGTDPAVIECSGCGARSGVPDEQTEAVAIAAWNRRAAIPARGVGVKPCGGCGNDDPLKRCIGCFHDFGTPDSAWVYKYAALAPTDAAEAEAHDEQLGVWADELMADLVLNDLMDLVDHDYDTKVGARREIIAALKKANQARVPHMAPTDAAQDDDPECTDCGGTGITYQTERVCACQTATVHHVNETPKSEHDGADVLTDAAQAREAHLREAAAKATEHIDMHKGKDMNSYRAALGVRDAILALIGEPRT